MSSRRREPLLRHSGTSRTLDFPSQSFPLDPGVRRDDLRDDRTMKASVIVFPGSNCDRDAAVALEAALGAAPAMVWHGDSASCRKAISSCCPGGFSYGDYLRSGAMAAHSPVMREVVRSAKAGTPVLGICNGFQVLTESGLLPGVLMRNATLRFICKDVHAQSRAQRHAVFARVIDQGEVVRIPIAHKDGAYFADEDDPRPARGREPHRLPLLRGIRRGDGSREPQWLAPQYRGHL